MTHFIRRQEMCMRTHTRIHTSAHTHLSDYCHWANYERQLALLTWQGEDGEGAGKCFYPQRNI